MKERVRFVQDWLGRTHSVAELCDMYGISRKSAYKWIDRYMHDGPDWARERSHAPAVVHNRTPQEVVAALMTARLQHRGWGARKLLRQVSLAHPEWVLPHESTVCDMLKRHGLVKTGPRRRHVGHPGTPRSVIAGPNDCWSTDFKGQFRLGDRSYCYPLTVTDNFSRYLLGCRGLSGTLLEPTKMAFTRLFNEYGLPERIRSDNGTPFAGTGLGRLSQLSVWWIKLGVLPELIEPGKPQQNGRHERMHRTLKDETTKPPGANAAAQQRRFNRFRLEFNEVRPHEALYMDTPSQWYRPSSRAMPTRLAPMEYPDRFEVRLVSSNGGIRWNRQWVNVTSALIGEHIGLEPIDDGLWDVYFGIKKLGRLHERQMCIEDEYGRLKRCLRTPKLD